MASQLDDQRGYRSAGGLWALGVGEVLSDYWFCLSSAVWATCSQKIMQPVHGSDKSPRSPSLMIWQTLRRVMGGKIWVASRFNLCDQTGRHNGSMIWWSLPFSTPQWEDISTHIFSQRNSSSECRNGPDDNSVCPENYGRFAGSYD